MKIGLCIESSTRAKAPALAAALENAGLDYISIGMTGADNEPELNYVQTGFLSALFLNLGIVDFVVGGCSTGQGYLNAVLQFPGTSAGLVLDSVDAFLFSQVNGGNVVSLALNKGYGTFGAELNLEYIFEKLFSAPLGGGYPKHRAEAQRISRGMLAEIAQIGHRPMLEILQRMDVAFIKHCIGFGNNLDYVRNAPPSEEKDFILGLFK